jgi:hypothetical protein
MPNRALILKEQFQKSLGFPFQKLLSEGEITRILEEEKLTWRNRLFNPMVTIWAFLSQVIDSDHSMRKAMSRVVAWLAKAGSDLPSTETSAYAKARKRLPESLLSRLFELTAQKLEEEVAAEDSWCGRRVVVWDGTTVSTADTPSNHVRISPTSQPSSRLWISLAQISRYVRAGNGSSNRAKNRSVAHRRSESSPEKVLTA